MKKTHQLVNAEEIAISAIGYLASDVDQLSRFFTLTGFDPASLRKFAGNTEFFVAVLDYFLHDEDLLITFCAQSSINPNHVSIAHNQLAN